MPRRGPHPGRETRGASTGARREQTVGLGVLGEPAVQRRERRGDRRRQLAAVLALPQPRHHLARLELRQHLGRARRAGGARAAGLDRDLHQPRVLAGQRGLDVGAQPRRWRVEPHPHLEERPQLGIDGLVERRQLGQLGQHLRQGGRAPPRHPQQRHRARDRQRPDSGQSIAGQLDHHDLVVVVGLGHRQRDRRAGVAHVLGAHPLRAVQVAERDVGHVVGERGAADDLLAGDHDAALGLRRQAAGQVQVAHRQQRLARPPLPPRRDQHLAEHRPHRVAAIAVGVEIPRAQVRHRRHQRADRAAGVAQRHHQRPGVDRAVGVAPDRADHVDAGRGQERRRRGQARRRVVVAGDRHHLQVRPAPVGLGQKAVPGRQRSGRRVAGVEHVAADQHRVDGLGRDRVAQPVEERRVLAIARQIVQRVPEVPIRRVQDPQHGPWIAPRSDRRFFLRTAPDSRENLSLSPCRTPAARLSR